MITVTHRLNRTGNKFIFALLLQSGKRRKRLVEWSKQELDPADIETGMTQLAFGLIADVQKRVARHESLFGLSSCA
jgi:hypothetical protein